MKRRVRFTPCPKRAGIRWKPAAGESEDHLGGAVLNTGVNTAGKSAVKRNPSLEKDG
jgi:hypothetical protein